MTTPNTLQSRDAAAGGAAIQPVTLSAVTWGFPLVGRSRMLTEAWVRAGVPTTFVQAPSYRGMLERLADPIGDDDDAPVVRPWPVAPARFWNVIGQRRLRRGIRRRANGLRRRLDRVLDWDRSAALVVSPLWTPWLEVLPFRWVLYDCIDDLSVQTPRPNLAQLYRDWEEELIARADAAVVTATALDNDIRRRRGNLPVAQVRNGVDARRFQAQAAAAPRPADVPNAGRSIVGFVGALYEWIDFDLIARVVRASPEFDFVFVGPSDGRGDVARIALLPNAVFLGHRPYARVPAYVQAFDVCWIPFRSGRVAQSANPVKVYEYLALGKPVVSTPVADTDSFAGLVAVGRTAEEITDLLRAAVREPPADADARRAFAAANSWDARARQIVDFVASLDARPTAAHPGA